MVAVVPNNRLQWDVPAFGGAAPEPERRAYKKMSPREFDAALAAFSKASKAWAIGERESPATELELVAFERKHGLRLPPEYRYIALNHGF